jgi:hypothetical protein
MGGSWLGQRRALGDRKRLTGGQLSQIKSTFDMNGMNGSRTCDAVKLAGNWWVVAPGFKHPAACVVV